MKKLSVVFLTSLLVFSCASPKHTFPIASEKTTGTLKLYADSTFKENIDGDSYSGRWNGSINKDSTVSLLRTNNGFQILTMTPVIIYKIKKGKIVVQKSH